VDTKKAANENRAPTLVIPIRNEYAVHHSLFGIADEAAFPFAGPMPPRETPFARAIESS
jgi:hypothetical protein